MTAWAQEPLKVVASFSILGDIVHQVGGEQIELVTIVGPDNDAHTYVPTPGDARALAEADVIFAIGLGFETWLEGLVEASGTDVAVSFVTDQIEPMRVEGVVDPHVWNSNANALLMVEAIESTLATSVAGFEGNGTFKAQVSAVGEQYRELFAALPANRRTVVTVHDAFGYLGAEMGLTFLAPIGVDGEAAPSARGLAELIKQVEEVGAAALFIENVNSPDLIEQIAEATGLEVNGKLYSDALSGPQGPAPSFLEMVRGNYQRIYAALSDQ